MRPVLAACLLLVLSGCFQSSSVLTVRPDGTATLRDEVTLSGMALMAIGQSDDPAFNASESEARAAAMGGGARLRSFEAREDGYTAIYDIDDVGGLTLGPPAGSPGEAEELSVSFDFDAGDPAVLRILVPKPAPSKPTSPAGSEENGEDEMGAQMLGMMRSMIGDARLTMAVEVEGEVIDSNAAARDGGHVTILDLPFMAILDAMEENPTLAESASSPASRMAEMNAIEGVVISTPGTTRIRFR